MEIKKYRMIFSLKNKDMADFINNIYAGKKDNIRILGGTFVKNNRNKAKLMINNKKYSLKEFIKVNEIKKDELKVYLIFHKNI